MAGSVNKVILIGHLGADPEIRSLGSGDRVANLRLATSESWKDRNSGERKEKTEWHRVVVFNENLVKVCENYLKKGAKIYVEGAIQTRKWSGQDGVEKYSTEIVLQKFRGEITMLDSRRDGEGGGDNRGYASDRAGRDDVDRGYGGGGGDREDFSANLDDEIPFATSRSIW